MAQSRNDKIITQMSLLSSKMPDKTQDLLPAGWKGKEEIKKTKEALEISYKWTHRKGAVLPHFLTEKRIETMNKANAVLPPFQPDYKPDGKCVTVQAATMQWLYLFLKSGWGWLALLPQGWMLRAHCSRC